MSSTSCLKTTEFDYCPGCTHSHMHLLLADVIQTFMPTHAFVGVNAPGCSIEISNYFSLPFISAPPGRATLVASGIKKVRPDSLVFTYQGDGDLYGNGLGSLLHAALRGEHITVFCVNNLVMASPGGQLSPTTRIGQKTATTPLGRSSSKAGTPLKIAELLATLPGVSLVQRISLHSSDAVYQATLAIKDAFQHQESGSGLSFIEVMGMCPTYWNTTPMDSREQLKQALLNDFTPGIYHRKTRPQ